MDKKRSVINIIVSISFKVILLIGSILVRRFLIQYIGNDVNGLNSLYISIIGVLSVAELGVGSAITFSMYQPIVDNNNAKVAALYQLFKKTYLTIGALILGMGIIIMPLIPYLARDYALKGGELYITFLLVLISVVLSYFFSAKTSLINAYKNNYITTTIQSCGMIIQYILQVITLIYTRSFEFYLICRIVAVLIQWGITEIITNARYKEIVFSDRQKLDDITKAQVVKNVKAMFMHKIGGILVNSVDSIVISLFAGVLILGKYSNYTTIAVSMNSVIMLFFTPLTSIIGHMFLSEFEQAKKYYDFFYTLNFIIGVVFFLGYYAVIDDLVLFLFGSGLKVSRAVSFVITLNYFIQFMRQSTLLFKDATGAFYNDRWKPLIEGLLNIVLSIILISVCIEWFGSEFGIVGVIIATIITNISICHTVEPYVLYKHAFKSSVKYHYLKNYLCIMVFVAALIITSFCTCDMHNPLIGILINGSISIGISLIIVLLTMILDKDFKFFAKQILKRFAYKQV